MGLAELERKQTQIGMAQTEPPIQAMVGEALHEILPELQLEAQEEVAL